MKVLYLEASSGRVVGGSLTGMLELIGGLDRDRVEPSVILYEDKRIIPDLDARGVRVRVFSRRRLPKEHSLQASPTYNKAKSAPGVTPLFRSMRATFSFLFETLPAALRLVPILQEEAPDVLHVCNGFRGNLDAIVAARLSKVPCVVHCKGFDKHSYLERYFAGGVGIAVCMTIAIENHCRRQGVKPPEYQVVYDGLDLTTFRPTRTPADVREELGIPIDAPVAGVVGHIQPWKGQHVLLEAMKMAIERFPDARAVIVGGAHRSGRGYSDGLRKYVEENGLADNVVFTGARDDVPDVMNAMDVVCHTSVRGEPFGRVIIEGMSVGKPVVATRAGGVPEFVRDGSDGLLVEPGDSAELAGVLMKLFGDADERHRLGTHALEAVKRFRVSHHVEQMMEIYERVIDRANSAKPGPRSSRPSSSAERV